MQDTISRISLYALPFLFSLCFHEFAHAYAAYKLGDPTAKYAGRLTLNPKVHIDLVWTIIIPAITLFIGGIFFGGAKPVPVDTRNFKNPMKDMAGPASNILLAVVFSIILAIFLKFFYSLLSIKIFLAFMQMLKAGIMINLFLAFFNLVPIPPLDGSKVLQFFLPYKYAIYMNMMSSYSMFLIVILWQFGLLRFLVGYPAFFMNNILMAFVQNVVEL